jgi:hypothetical protein|tara:strand:- start:416 stop:736 length:321 start_codon:yes stop_codon:yes gene_type:complete
MKKAIIVTFVTTLFTFAMFSCERECNCGEVTSDGMDTDPNTSELYYWVVIQNDCSDNYKKFYLEQSDWFDAYVGEPYCITNVDSWMVDNNSNLIPLSEERYNKIGK